MRKTAFRARVVEFVVASIAGMTAVQQPKPEEPIRLAT